MEIIFMDGGRVEVRTTNKIQSAIDTFGAILKG